MVNIVAGAVGDAGSLAVGDAGHSAGWKKHATALRKLGVRSPCGQPLFWHGLLLQQPIKVGLVPLQVYHWIRCLEWNVTNGRVMVKRFRNFTVAI